jgi:hypothetical protein
VPCEFVLQEAMDLVSHVEMDWLSASREYTDGLKVELAGSDRGEYTDELRAELAGSERGEYGGGFCALLLLGLRFTPVGEVGVSV